MVLRGPVIVRGDDLKAMVARLWRGREWRYALAAALTFFLVGCGGSDLGELLKDAPSQQQNP
jgi:hypothetical protein